VAIWIIRQSPRSDPKFHQTEIFEGAGRSARASFAIFNSGCVFRRLVITILAVGSQQWFTITNLGGSRGKIMTYLMYLIMLGLVFGLVAVASNPSPYFAALGLVVVAGLGCGLLVGHGGSFLSLVLFLIYLGGMLVVFAYSAALAAEPFPES